MQFTIPFNTTYENVMQKYYIVHFNITFQGYPSALNYFKSL